MGIGTVATYGQRGDTYRFYEINPLIIQFAQQSFQFLSGSQATTEIVPGDARLSLEREEPQGFDALILDAFSGDSIPVHLLTREAMQDYWRHLKPDGVLIIHISNRNLTLEPIVNRLAIEYGLHVLHMHSDKAEGLHIFIGRVDGTSQKSERLRSPRTSALTKQTPAGSPIQSLDRRLQQPNRSHSYTLIR